MASYQLIASESTVQVVAANVVNDVVYCTIITSPSSVIASLPVSKKAFQANQAAEELTSFADNIEQLMLEPGVIGGTGEQSIDTNGLLADYVAFTVRYVPAGGTDTNITAEASVPVGLLSEGGDPTIERILFPQAQAIIAAVYANLQSAAGG